MGTNLLTIYSSHQQLYDIPRSLGAEVNFWKLREEKIWYPNIEELKNNLYQQY